MRLGGFAEPLLARLGTGRPVTLDVFHARFEARLRLPKETPFEIKCADPPGGIVSRMACKSAVISRASNSMNPDPCIATVFRPFAMLCSVTKLPASSLAPLVGIGSEWSKVEKSNRWPKTNTRVPNSPPPPTTGLLWHPKQEFMSGAEMRLKLRGNSKGLLGSETAAPVPLVSGRPPPSSIVQFAVKSDLPNLSSLSSRLVNSCPSSNSTRTPTSLPIYAATLPLQTAP